jgi:hypothetical protein
MPIMPLRLWIVIGMSALLFTGRSLQADHGAHHGNNTKTVNHAFQAGETLTYTITWSDVVEAGTAVLEVKAAETTKNGRRAFRLISTARTSGLVSKFYRVEDRIQSTMDNEELYTLAYSLDQKHGSRKKRREMTFDQSAGTVQVLRDGIPEQFTVPERVQDALSSLYYARTRQDFTVGKPILIDVYDDGRTWSVELQTLGREKITTPLGEFNAIKVKTYPKYEGVFQNKGEIYMWLTDDARKIPLLMKSKISIGTVIATLTGMQTGETVP